MANPTLVATVQASNVPPRVKIDVTDTGTPTVTSVTVTRLDPSGFTSTVRTPDGNPLVLTTSGSNRIGTVYDYEMPLGSPVTYSLVQNTASTATVTVTSSLIWLVHPGVPALSMPITVASLGSRVRRVKQGVFFPMGRANPVVVTDGSRKGVAGSLDIQTFTLAELGALEALTADGGVLLLNIPAGLNWGIPTSYIAIGDMEEARLVDYGPEPRRYVTLPFQVVDSPIGGSQAQWTWANVTAQYATWSALMAGEPTWADVLAPTN